MAAELAERRGEAVADARALIAAADLTAPMESPAEPAIPVLAESAPLEQHDPVASADPGSSTTSYEESLEDSLTASESFAALAAQAPSTASADVTAPDADVRAVLENGIREIAGEVRNSLDFHRSQEGGGEVATVVLSGAALDVPGFSDVLEAELRVPLTRETVGVTDGAIAGGASVSPQRLAIAAGLSVEEAPR